MSEFDFVVFAGLFNEVYTKCFGGAMEHPLTETESKLICNRVLDQTGLAIGWKSVKNYSLFITEPNAVKQQNPSVATLDTLARYVLGAPHTTEIHRKNDESHYPYWFLYKEKFSPGDRGLTKKTSGWRKTGMLTILVLILVSLGYLVIRTKGADHQFNDSFAHLSEADLKANGWLMRGMDTSYWNKRAERAGSLTLYTLRGDNWPDPAFAPGIRNLLLREIRSDCFTAEVHLQGFIPQQEWQQAGILLMEDTTYTGKSIRLSLAYNDNFGGLKKPAEILIQAITSTGNGYGKPEEIAHKPIFHPDSMNYNNLLALNLKNSALRIEKHGSKFRFLYAAGSSENSAFREVVSQELHIYPRYIGIFAIKGFTNAANVPVRFKFFRLTAENCN